MLTTQLQTQVNFEAHIGMISKILGPEGLFDGRGADAFMRAASKFTPERGVKFPTFLYHNLVLQKKIETGKAMKRPNPEQFIPVEDAGEWLAGGDQPHQVVEFLDSLSHLSDDAKVLVKMVLGSRKKTKRTKWPTEVTATRMELRAELKQYCLADLSWTSTRYYAAFKEIKEMLK